MRTPIIRDLDQQAAWFAADELPSGRAPDLDVIINHLNRTRGS